MSDIQPGPCVVCGLRNYGLSCGGPTICPTCDCGATGPATIEAQRKRIEELERDLDVAITEDHEAIAADRAVSRALGRADANDSLRLGVRIARYTFPDGTTKDALQQAWISEDGVQWCDVPVHHVPYESAK